MKYRIHIRSDKNIQTTPSDEYIEKTIIVEAADCCDAVGLAMKEADDKMIDSIYLPLKITIEEEK